jgi:NADPH:quinone reductase-like Zn-dependent oxidoreductase
MKRNTFNFLCKKVATPGLLESLQWVEQQQQQITPLGEDEVEIRVVATGINLIFCAE